MRKALVALVVLGAVAFMFPAQARAAVGRFVIRCSYSHTLADDPIVHFGQPGASHMHDFYGNIAEDAFSTVDTMVGQATTCKTTTDPSGYWVPTTLINGVPVKPIRVITYWEAPANQNVETIPLGLQMIAGDHDSMVPQRTTRVGWACDNDTAGVIHSPMLDHPYDCTPYNAAVGHGNGVVERAIFPSCWDVDRPCTRGCDLSTVPQAVHTQAHSAHGTVSSRHHEPGRADAFQRPVHDAALRFLRCVRSRPASAPRERLPERPRQLQAGHELAV